MSDKRIQDYVPEGYNSDQLKEFNNHLREFSKMIQVAEYRIKSFDRANTQPYQDHAFMETIREYIKNKAFCDTPRIPSQEMLAKFAIKPDSPNARVLAIFENYFEIKNELDLRYFQERGED